MGHFFEDGGFTMIPILVLGFVLVGVAGLDALRPGARLRGVIVSLGAAMAAAGGLGFVMAVVATLRGTQQVTDNADRIVIIIGGFAESANNLVIALVFLVLTAMISAVGAFRGRTLA